MWEFLKENAAQCLACTECPEKANFYYSKIPVYWRTFFSRLNILDSCHVIRPLTIWDPRYRTCPSNGMSLAYCLSCLWQFLLSPLLFRDNTVNTKIQQLEQAVLSHLAWIGRCPEKLRIAVLGMSREMAPAGKGQWCGQGSWSTEVPWKMHWSLPNSVLTAHFRLAGSSQGRYSFKTINSLQFPTWDLLDLEKQSSR